MSAARFGATPSRSTRNIILIVIGVLFLVPILAMIEFTLEIGQPVKGVQQYGIQHYLDVFNPANESTYDGLFQGVQNSLIIALFTVIIILVLLLPTMILIELKFPRFRKVLEFICLIPITIPTVVLVVGFIPAYQAVAQIFGSTPYTLAFAIGIICLPYAFRPIATNLAAVEVTTLSEAARSLGASWLQVMMRVILPNLRRGILSAILLTVAVVLGEYTIASFLSQTTFQTALLLIQQTDPYAGVIFAVFALVFVFILLVLIGRVGTLRGGRAARKRVAK
ncbi:MAG: putative spermidine/putrescine transport system permease protein [Actinomycetota bacterium]|nr:putative spermidine/putrescine transport system permease protein [Actinomycetota bacterium]